MCHDKPHKQTKMNFSFKTFLLLCFAIHIFGNVCAQTKKEPALELKMERTKNGEKLSLDINASLYKPGSYTVLMLFTERENTDAPVRALQVARNSGNLFNIEVIDTKQAYNCRYRYFYTAGYQSKKMDSTFVYRLPYSTNRSKPVQVSYSYNLNQHYFNRTNSKNWASLHFRLEKGDTIFAIRKGKVINIEDGNELPEYEETVSYTSSINSMSIEHSDGTICHYNVIEKGSFMVSEGDIVYPGTPLAMCGKLNKTKEDYQLKLNVRYPVENPEFDLDDPKSSAFLYVYYNPVFATDKGETKLVSSERYNAVSSDELIQKEMTKKELKKFKK